MGPRGRAPEAHPHAGLRRPDLRFPHHGRTRQRPFERRVRRQICPRPRRTQGQMPSHVRHRRACRRSDHPRRRLKDRPGLTHPGSPPPPGAGKFTSLRVFCKKLTVFGLIASQKDWGYNSVTAILVEATEDGEKWLQSNDGKGWLHANTVDEEAPIPAERGEVWKVLGDAVKAGGVGLNRITRWVESGGNLEWTASNGWTLLHFAAENGNEALVRLLIRHGANVDARDNRGATPLMLACDSGYLGRTKNSSVVLLLLDSGADPNARDSDGKTAFGLVRRSRDDEDRKIAELLMDRTKLVAGSDIDCPECGAPTSREMAKRDV